MRAVSTADIEWLNTNETAKRLGITPRTLYRFIDDGKIPAYRFGRVIRLKESEVAAFIEDSRIVPGTLDTAALEDADDEADRALLDPVPVPLVGRCRPGDRGATTVVRPGCCWRSQSGPSRPRGPRRAG